MADKLEFEVVTPERRVVAETVDEVILPSAHGYMGVLPGHAPLLAMVDSGEVSYRIGKQLHYLAVSGGFAEVLRDSVSIMASTSERAEEIDLERAQQSKEKAQSEMRTDAPKLDFERAEARLKRAISRINVRGRVKH